VLRTNAQVLLTGEEVKQMGNGETCANKVDLGVGKSCNEGKAISERNERSSILPRHVAFIDKERGRRGKDGL